jgi:hypothetical protein
MWDDNIKMIIKEAGLREWTELGLQLKAAVTYKR